MIQLKESTQQVPKQQIDASQPGPSSAIPPVSNSFRAPIRGLNSQTSKNDFVQIRKPLTAPR